MPELSGVCYERDLCPISPSNLELTIIITNIHTLAVARDDKSRNLRNCLSVSYEVYKDGKDATTSERIDGIHVP